MKTLLRRALPQYPSHRTTAALHTTLPSSVVRLTIANNALRPLSNRASTANTLRPHALTHTAARAMSSDADYAAFLDKANQDVAPAEQQDVSSKKGYGTKNVNTAVPKALESVEEYYVSDADEPFEPVALEFSGDEITAGDLAKLIGGDKEVEEHKAKGFETQYKTVIDAVKKAGNGQVKVFRVELEGTRAEYYVVSIDKEGGKVIGLKALSVES
ncbi:hypothetical protein ST47_g10160 [Ascochyta rabiei]|uniref:Uncharacterized protein n=2 Tax=Didymella rabiei TaxID=5454 RepID=A0A162W6J9_DIDRA|nr:hypothetical protein ST47_g10160 [Ascochyta rabiei]